MQACQNLWGGLICRYQHTSILNGSSLPNLVQLIDNLSSYNARKAHIKNHLAIKVHLNIFDTCEDYHLSDCQLHLLKPVLHWSVTLGDVHMSHYNNFHIRLLVRCDGLKKDAARFSRQKNAANIVVDPSCKLCGTVCEDAIHFVSVSCSQFSSNRFSQSFPLIQSRVYSVTLLLTYEILLT